MFSGRLMAWLVVSAVACAAHAVHAPPPGAQAPRGSTILAGIDRADLAAAYMELDREIARAAAAGRLTPEMTAEINRRFDVATVQFFQNRRDAAIATMREIVWSLHPAPPSGSARAFASVRVVAEPPVWFPGAGSIRFTVERLFTTPELLGENVVVRLLPPGDPGSAASTEGASGTTTPPAQRPPVIGTVRLPFDYRMPADAEFAGSGDGSSLDWTPPDGASGRLEPGLWSIELRLGAEGRVVGVLPVLDEAPSVARARLLERLDAGLGALPEARRAALSAAAMAFRSRAGLLVDRPSRTDSAQFLLDPHALARELSDEVAALARGENPYAGRAGTIWRTVPVGPESLIELPVMVVVPEGLVEPAPLIIALHGAGGDERMFIDAYGAGSVAALAKRHGAIVVSPRATMMMTSPLYFDGIVETIAAEHAIDRKRIVVLGHSMGGSGAALLARRRADQVAAVAIIASPAAAVPDATIPQLIVIAGLDTVTPATPSLRASLAALVDRGIGVELLEFPDHGHTLVVGAALPQVVEWLLGK